MDNLRVGSINVNGGRDRHKRDLLLESIQLKRLNVVLLQETHSDVDNEADWKMCWKGQQILSHGTNLSAGVAILFSPETTVNILSSEEVIKGRLVLVKAEIEDFLFCFINVYVPNVGHERITFFKILSGILKQCHSNDNVIVGGDWNCTENFTIDRTSEEPHMQSSIYLSKIVKEAELLDMWRIKHNTARQYTWLKVSDDRVSAARLDRIYISKCSSNRVVECSFFPVGFSDHHMVLMSLVLSKSSRKSSYWHFNAKLLQDVNFCKHFEGFWECWKKKKHTFDKLRQWWEIGKTQIQMFCQQYTVNSTNMI